MTYGLRFGGLAAWTGAGSVFNLSLGGAGFMTGSRTYRDGLYGPTIGGHYIAVEGDTNQYFWFSQNDGNGNYRGYDPAYHDLSLNGFIGNEVQLSGGILSGIDIASSLEEVMSSTLDVSRIGNNISINGVSDVFSGFGWDSRGPAGLWGLHLENSLSNNFAQNNTILSYAETPNVSGTILLRGMGIRIGTTFSDRIRLALYQGGTTTDPAGASLVYDFGQLPVSTPLNSWYTLFVSGNVEITSGSLMWFAAISAGDATTSVGYESSTAGRTGNFTASQRLFDGDVSIGSDPSVSAPSVISAGTVQTGFSFVIGMRAIYETTPIVTNGEWRRLYGMHVEPSVLANSTSFNANVFVGGNLPPPISGSYVDYIEIAGDQNPNYRLGIYQGGVVVNPNNATLLFDGGRPVTSTGLDWYRVTGSITAEIDPYSPIWVASRGNGTLGFIRFDFGAPNQASPPNEPYDYPANTVASNYAEYEALSLNVNHSTNPDVGFEDVFIRDAVNDTTPGNVPGLRFGIRSDSIQIQ